MPYATRILAPNPGPFTLEGTNTWVVGRDPSLVLDPGPDDADHLDEVARTAGRVAAVLLSHRHPDHAPGAAALARRTGAPVHAFDPEPGERPIADGQAFAAGGVTLVAVHTPGHTPDHVVFHDPEFGALFTGDAVLGRGTSIVDPPEGDMAAYLASLERLRRLTPRLILPGHGPAAWDAPGKLEEYVEHRAAREQQVLRALSRGARRTVEELVPKVYRDTPKDLHSAAARSLLAHLLKLEAEGRVERVDGERFARLPARPAQRTSSPRKAPGTSA